MARLSLRPPGIASPLHDEGVEQKMRPLHLTVHLLVIEKALLFQFYDDLLLATLQLRSEEECNCARIARTHELE